MNVYIFVTGYLAIFLVILHSILGEVLFLRIKERKYIAVISIESNKHCDSIKNGDLINYLNAEHTRY